MNTSLRNGKEPADACGAAAPVAAPQPFIFGSTVAAEASTSGQNIGSAASSCPKPLDAQENISAKATKLAQNEYLLTGDITSGSQRQQKLEKAVNQKTFGLFFGENVPQWFKDCRVTENSLVMNSKLYSDSIS